LVNSATGVGSAPQNNGNFNNLIAGTYQVIVTSFDCVSPPINVVISQPASPLVFTASITNVLCNGEGNGRVTINAGGGTGQISYAISPNLNQFFTTNTFSNLLPGNYDMIIQDANGCFIPFSFPITEPANLTSSLQGILTQELCAGDNSASFVVNVAGGTLPYSYSVDNQNGLYTLGSSTQTQFTITGQSGGNHFVYIRDANGCITSRVPVALDQAVSIGSILTPELFCPDAAVFNAVTVAVNPSVGGQVQYSLDGGTYQASNVFQNLGVGSHYINVRHTNGCITPNQDFVITRIAPLTLSLVQGGLNEIVAIVSGGNGGYQYSINGVDYGSASTFVIDRTGTYSVMVTDRNGCTKTETISMVFVDIFIPNVFTPNGDGINDMWTPQNTFNYKSLVYYIFDRYGRKIITRTEGQFWDGTYNGVELPSGDYWYVIKVDGESSGSDREFVGNLTLYR
jgi:gliding motility-associated-like protein